MRDKSGGPRRERQTETSREAEHLRGEAATPPTEPRAPIPPEFAAAVQVTETERAWIREHLAWFLENNFITDVVRRIKAGKEATVYACSAHPSTGRSMIAAKVYREWSLRGAHNMSQYQQGRALLDEDGNAGQGRSSRSGQAGSKKSKRAKVAVETSWLMHEFTLLESLHALGADVPQPIEHGNHALLMEYIGDGADAAPTLNDVELEPDEAKRLFERVIHNVEILLGLGWVHGDLSEYNILYDRGRIVLIDFPQVADCRNNPKARALFERDIERVTRYFERAGHGTDPRQLARELWAKHISDSSADDAWDAGLSAT
jgi:RIO kinase 1